MRICVVRSNGSASLYGIASQLIMSAANRAEVRVLCDGISPGDDIEIAYHCGELVLSTRREDGVSPDVDFTVGTVSYSRATRLINGWLASCNAT